MSGVLAEEVFAEVVTVFGMWDVLIIEMEEKLVTVESGNMDSVEI